ncbi:MAG: hypothetical protein Q4C70_10785, partial [Planctomycetia bacterium]|nr:hypothetical protein [Planctomycetia bacterium]
KVSYDNSYLPRNPNIEPVSEILAEDSQTETIQEAIFILPSQVTNVTDLAISSYFDEEDEDNEENEKSKEAQLKLWE